MMFALLAIGLAVPHALGVEPIERQVPDAPAIQAPAPMKPPRRVTVLTINLWHDFPGFFQLLLNITC